MMDPGGRAGAQMFGLDWIAVLAAGIGGAVGGALGALIASYSRSGIIKAMLIVAPIVLGARLAPAFIQPELEKAVGPQVRTVQFDAVYESEIRPDIVKQASLARVFKDDPKVETAFKDELRKAYQTGGAKGALEAAAGIGARTLGDVFARYMPRARGEDLLSYTKTMAAILQNLRDNDPEACVLMLFGSQHGQSMPTSRLKTTIGDQGMKSMLAVNNQIVANAGEVPVEFDMTQGEALTTEIAQRHAGLLTEKSAEVATGARLHTTREEAHAACAFSTALFVDIMALPPQEAETVLRYMFHAG
jgi:hypothetical protein